MLVAISQMFTHQDIIYYSVNKFCLCFLCPNFLAYEMLLDLKLSSIMTFIKLRFGDYLNKVLQKEKLLR